MIRNMIRNMISELKKFIKENTLDSISILLSFIAIIVSIATFGKSASLQEKSTRYNTYNMDLNYHLKFFDELAEDEIFVDNDNDLITIVNDRFLEIVPLVGGVQKLYVVFGSQEDVTDMTLYDMYNDDILDYYEAQNGSYTLQGLILDIMDEDDEYYYSSVFLVLEDYKHNIFSNMITFKIHKDDLNVQIRIFEEIDLLYAYNREIDAGFSMFDVMQIKEYLNLKKKFDEII